MKVMVVGAGEVGFHIAELLSRERHAVTVIEQNPQHAAQLRNKLKAFVAEGNGASTEVLEAAHISDMELFIAVTDLDEVNLIACLLAHAHGVPRIIAHLWLDCHALFGGLPSLLADVSGVRNFADAFFEAMSGFSTTGATVITSLDQASASILFWRAMTQWLGGMGIIVLSLAILPFLGVGGMQLFEAESPGPTKDRLSPRIQDTAKVLWGVYAILTLAETFLLWAGGMSVFESLCHAFTTMATGGFSTRDASIAAFGSYTQVVIGLFMLLAGVNPSLRQDLAARVAGLPPYNHSTNGEAM